MVSYIKGKLAEVFEDTIVIENNGMGFNVRVPASLLDSIPSVGEMVKVYTYLYVREDAINLFGFLTRQDLDVFKLLLNVNGIGPKGALGILSTITPDDLRFAVLSDDVKAISKAPGIGTKTAQKLIIELKDKLKLEYFTDQGKIADGQAISASSSAKNEALEALVALGYANSEAIKTVNMVENVNEKDTETILKEALKKMAFL